MRREYPSSLRPPHLRPISFLGRPFDVYGPGEIVAWSRILDDEEAVCILNAHGTDSRGADVLVDANLNLPATAMTVVLNTAQEANPQGYTGTRLGRDSRSTGRRMGRRVLNVEMSGRQRSWF